MSGTDHSVSSRKGEPSSSSKTGSKGHKKVSQHQFPYNPFMMNPILMNQMLAAQMAVQSHMMSNMSNMSNMGNMGSMGNLNGLSGNMRNLGALTPPVPNPFMFTANKEDSSGFFPRKNRKKGSGRNQKRNHTDSFPSASPSLDYVPIKIQKTDIHDLQFQLENSNEEVAMLKKELNEKDEEIRRLQAQLSKLQVTNEDQLNRLRLLESQDQARFHDIQTIQNFKARLELLQELERQQIREESEAEESPMPNNSPGDVMMMSPHPTTPPSERTRSPSLTSPAAAHKFLFPPSVSEPWNRQIPKAFREKVDFSKIQLKSVEPPPNLVETARMQYYESHRQWEHQQNNIERLKPREPYRAPRRPFTEKIDLSEKISQLRKTHDNNQETGSNQMEDVFMTQVMSPSPTTFDGSNNSFGNSANSYGNSSNGFDPAGNFGVSASSYNGSSFCSSSGGFDDRMDSDESMFSHPNSHSDHSHILGNEETDDMDLSMMDFLSIPTPTARLLNTEFSRRNSQID